MSCTNNGNKVNRDISFAITFASCFQNDTTSLTINGIEIFRNVILNSEFSTGLTGVTMSHKYESNQLDLKINGIYQRISITTSQLLKLSVTKNNKEYWFNFQLSKGRNILIEGCESKIMANQFKRRISFE
jgi:hypothetical protein